MTWPLSEFLAGTCILLILSHFCMVSSISSIKEEFSKFQSCGERISVFFIRSLLKFIFTSIQMSILINITQYQFGRFLSLRRFDHRKRS
ncbi:hypothetical protein F0562_021371 [Nyssa sinensis]|uniref:Uncharacterized protein n=1 Tax=Nyssa sinensis TaxID=561372 RepID=A0A5J5BK78_9ASTE|nr:hypothetical protein F0562_021371 [Nyssa sinensis]